MLSVERICMAHDAVRNYLRHRTRVCGIVPPRVHRERYRARSVALRATLGAA